MLRNVNRNAKHEDFKSKDVVVARHHFLHMHQENTLAACMRVIEHKLTKKRLKN